jgi:hypothetical protein
LAFTILESPAQGEEICFYKILSYLSSLSRKMAVKKWLVGNTEKINFFVLSPTETCLTNLESSCQVEKDCFYCTF